MPSKVIKPKKDPFADAKKRVEAAQRQLAAFGVAAVSEMSKYPAFQPDWPRRSGEYGRRWYKKGPYKKGNAIVVEVGNNALNDAGEPYGVWVGGPTEGEGKRQVKFHGRHGWRSITQTKKKTWPTYKKRIGKHLSASANYL